MSRHRFSDEVEFFLNDLPGEMFLSENEPESIPELEFVVDRYGCPVHASRFSPVEESMMADLRTAAQEALDAAEAIRSGETTESRNKASRVAARLAMVAAELLEQAAAAR